MFAALNISDSVEREFDVFFAWIGTDRRGRHPGHRLLHREIGPGSAGGLTQAGLDRNLLSGRSGEWVSKVAASPSRLIGRIAFWAIFLAFVSIAASALGIEAVSAFVAAVWGYLPNVIAALAIFLVAGAISAGVATLATRLMGRHADRQDRCDRRADSGHDHRDVHDLEQLKIAHDIVVTTYTLLLGSIALGAAWRSASAAATSLRECSRVRTRRASERPVRSSKTSSAPGMRPSG